MTISTPLPVYRKPALLLAIAACLLASACAHADGTNSASCKLVAGLEFAGTVTDPTGRSQNTLMTLTRVSGASNGGQVTFNGSVSGTDTWVTDSARMLVQNGQTRLLTANGDTLALACTNATRSLSCQNSSRGKCLLSEVAH